ncbi:hypothetical protein ES703_121196 [subsurface metagenome]
MIPKRLSVSVEIKASRIFRAKTGKSRRKATPVSRVPMKRTNPRSHFFLIRKMRTRTIRTILRRSAIIPEKKGPVVLAQ